MKESVTLSINIHSRTDISPCGSIDHLEIKTHTETPTKILSDRKRSYLTYSLSVGVDYTPVVSEVTPETTFFFFFFPLHYHLNKRERRSRTYGKRKTGTYSLKVKETENLTS